MSEALFDGYEPMEPEPVEKVSADRRRTLRQAANIAAGIHPLTKGKLHARASRDRDASSPKTDPFTCGSCYFREVQQHRGKTYPKCTFWDSSHSAATDVRAWWPACFCWAPRPPARTPEAARRLP
jgi:hypothetical protein